jgi:hypothetical protein
MQTVPFIGDRRGEVSFFPDDTVLTVRQLLAVKAGTHPDRLFVEVEVKLPKDYYSSNPKHWMELFYRLAYNRDRVTADAIRKYAEDRNIRVPIRDYSGLDWEEKHEDLAMVLKSSREFTEWRIFGVPAENSLVLPLPPAPVPDYTGVAPLPRLQSLVETHHPTKITQFRIKTFTDDPDEPVRKNYFPYYAPDSTPENIVTLKPTLEAAQQHLIDLLSLDAPAHRKVSILRVKWIVPLISTRFNAPRSRFEQIFYGLTVSKDTPYIGYFTAKTEVIRHKFYVENPETKEIKESFKTMWKAWANKTQPQRRRPTLLLYRGKSRTNFDRIAITDKDIIFSAERDKASTDTVDSIRKSLTTWFESLDAVVPFVVPEDIDESRWQLDTLNAISTYERSLENIYEKRIPCLQNVFSYYKDTFRLLRAENTSDDISPLEIQAYQILSQDDVTPSADLLREELGLTSEDAEALFSKISSLGDTFDIEKAAKSYPVIKFQGNEVIIKFVANIERTLKYADILRYIISSNDDADVNRVCPGTVEVVAPVVSVPQEEIADTDYDASNADFLAGIDFGVGAEEAAADVAPGGAAAAGPSRVIAVAQKTESTFNYFNTRLQKFDPRTFDRTYPGECERNRQVVVLTPKQQEDIRREKGEVFTYSARPNSEKLPLTDPDGLAICPPYWCIYDEIPLLPPSDPPEPGQLVRGDDGELRCPICNGTIRKSDRDSSVRATVIERKTNSMYPNFMKALSATNKRRLPCCYRVPRADSVVLGKFDDVNYVLGLERSQLPPMRFAYLDGEIAERLRIKTNYDKTIKVGRLSVGQHDIFRVGLGRPSKTMPMLLKISKEIPSPRDAPDNVKKCSFFLTWRKPSTEGASQTERIINGIDEAYESGDMDILDEVEYVASILLCKVYRIDPKTKEMTCGFWSEYVKPEAKTIVLVGTDALGYVSRTKGISRAHKLEYTANIRAIDDFEETVSVLDDTNAKACATNLPTYIETLNNEIRPKGIEDYSLILDPIDRVQAFYIPGRVILPIRPESRQISDIASKFYYNQLRDSQLPDPATARAFLEATRHPGFKIEEEIYNAEGDLVEFLLKSGFRSPVKYGIVREKGKPNREVVETIRALGEKSLLEGEPNEDDKTILREVTYGSEIYEFLLFSLSKDIQLPVDAKWKKLREAIEFKKKDEIMGEVRAWFNANAFTALEEPSEFINKVRKPCGQFKTEKKCENSTLCGWQATEGKKGVCRIKVKVKGDEEIATTRILNRIVTALLNNEKLRILVLDDRISPFFSTVLYLEMPNELITTDV